MEFDRVIIRRILMNRKRKIVSGRVRLFPASTRNKAGFVLTANGYYEAKNWTGNSFSTNINNMPILIIFLYFSRPRSLYFVKSLSGFSLISVIS